MAADWGISFAVPTKSGRFFFGGKRRVVGDRRHQLASGLCSTAPALDSISRPASRGEAYMPLQILFAAGSCSMVLATAHRRHLT
jgi:hypothetical protein